MPPKRRFRGKRRGAPTRSGPIMLRGYRPTSYLDGVGRLLKMARMATSSLPLGEKVVVLDLVDLAFNLIKTALQQVEYYVGAFCMFNITPAALLKNSPFLARDSGGGYTFPGHPVSMRHLNIRIRNTTKGSEHSGRWAAVFIPFREEHDSAHYSTVIKNLTFAETCAMPHAKIGRGDQDLSIRFRMRDRTNYCARPRELTEFIGTVYVIWDNVRDSSTFATAYQNSDFSCEIDLTGGCVPHQIFGSAHRVNYNKDDFKIKAITDGKLVRVHNLDGTIIHRSYHEELLLNKVKEVKVDESFDSSN